MGSSYDLALTLQGTLVFENPNALIDGNLLVDGGSLTAEKYTLIDGDVFIRNKGQITLGSNSRIKGNVYILSGGGYLDLKNTSSVEGNIYVQTGGKVTLYDSASINGDVFMYSGGELTLNSQNSVDGNINVQDGGKILLQGYGRVSGNIIIQNGPNQSIITIQNNIKFSDTSGIYFMGPLESGNTLPKASEFRPKVTGQVHVKDLKYFTNSINPDVLNTAYCTGNKTSVCKHKVPTFGGGSGGSSGGGGTSDTTITTETWDIGSYTGQDLSN